MDYSRSFCSSYAILAVHSTLSDNPYFTHMQIVEEEFKQTAAKLGVPEEEARSLAHRWASPEAQGIPDSPANGLEDSAHHYGNNSIE